MRKEYAHNEHWKWLTEVGVNNISDLGKQVANILGYVGGGLYNAPINYKKVDWNNNYSVQVTWSHNGLSNWDFPSLTGLWVECHRRMIRVTIGALAPNRLSLLFHQRETREGSSTERMPDCEEAIRLIDKIWGRPQQETTALHAEIERLKTRISELEAKIEVPEQRDEKSVECGITSSDQFTVGSHAVIRFQNGIRVRGRITKVEGGKYFLKTPAGSDLVAGFIWMEVATDEERRLTEEEEKAVPK